MTTTTPAQIFAETWPVFLDFDGPVTHLFIDGRNVTVANRMRTVLRDHGIQKLDEAATTDDPLIVLRWTYRNSQPAVFNVVEQTCIDGEVQAASVSEPTAGSTLFIRACRAARRPLIILSNNAEEAIQAYVDRHRLAEDITAVVGRARGNPELMKPNPYLVELALQQAGVVPARIAFIGDSITDVEVGTRTGLRTIGYAKHPERGRQLDSAGAEALTEAIEQLAVALADSTVGIQPSASGLQ